MLYRLFFICLFFIQAQSVYLLNKNQKKKLLFYKPLIDQLSFFKNKADLNALFLDKRVRFEKKLILLNLDQPSIKKYVNESLRNKAVKLGFRFLKRHLKIFLKAEKFYKVSKEIIVAILYIETNFNLKKAKYNVFNAFISLAYANKKPFIDINLKRLIKKYHKLSKKKINKHIIHFKSRSTKKAMWALEQLKALFKVSKSMRSNILNLKGSFAGAIGYPQFIPTSYLDYAVDGDCNYIIDLYNIYDAIFSVANYLSAHDFKLNNLSSQKKAIYHYNNNDDYVRFVIEYSKKLKLIINS